jgi:hypothetical protein
MLPGFLSDSNQNLISAAALEVSHTEGSLLVAVIIPDPLDYLLQEPMLRTALQAVPLRPGLRKSIYTMLPVGGFLPLIQLSHHCRFDPPSRHHLSGTGFDTLLLGLHANIVTVAPRAVGGVTRYHAVSTDRTLEQAL